MEDGAHGEHEERGTVRRRTVLATTLGALPAITAYRTGAAQPAVAAPVATPADSGGTSVTGLTTEHRTNPLGIDAPRPLFGWRTHSTTRGCRQTAYRILVATDPRRLAPGRADGWDGGRVASSDSVAVPYAGPALRAATRYHWTVTVWDEHGRARTAPAARFETGLLGTDGVANWDGARWIGMAAASSPTPRVPSPTRTAPPAPRSCCGPARPPSSTSARTWSASPAAACAVRPAPRSSSPSARCSTTQARALTFPLG